MAAYRRVYDSRHLQADCQVPGSAPEPALGNRVWATFFILKLCVIELPPYSRERFKSSRLSVA